MKQLHRALRRLGRRGDTELAHVTKGEMALLEALGGSGTRNPKSGLREFFEDDGGGGGPGPSDSGSGQDGGSGQDSGMGMDSTQSSDPGLDSGDYTSDDDPSNFEGGTGGLLGGEGQDLGVGGPGTPVYDSGLQGPGSVPSPGTPDRALGGLPGGTERGFFDSLFSMDKVRENLDPRTQRGLFNAMTALAPSQFSLGARGMYELAQALGTNIGRPVNEMFGGSALAQDFSFGNGNRFGDSGFGDAFSGIDMGPSEASRDFAGALIGATPVSNPVPQSIYGKMSSDEVPGELLGLFGPGMDDLQKRAMISTYGTQGSNSLFRADPVKRYYARLLNNAIVDQGGNPVQDPYTLPIEHLYWQGILGRPVADPAQSRQILDAIRSFL